MASIVCITSMLSERRRPCVGDFVRVGLPDLVCPKRGNCDRLALERHELDFESPAFAMHEHDGADVSGRKLVLRQIAHENDFSKFLNHGDRFPESSQDFLRRLVGRLEADRTPGDEPQLLLHTSKLIAAAKRSSASDGSVRSLVRNSSSSTGDRPALAAMVWSGSSLR